MKTAKKLMAILLAFLMLAGTVAAGGSVAFADKSGAYSAGDIIEYGTYPQSRVEGTDDLNEAAEIATWKSYNYYYGNGVYYNGNMAANDFAEFADFVLEGVKYRAVRFTQFRPYLTGNITGESFSYVDNNGYSLNTVYFFKYEPVQWIVLDPSTGFVVSTKHIDSQAFSNYLVKVGADMYGADEYFANDYSHSSIKPWLNDDFYNTAFTDYQKSNINADNDLGGIYLLSTEEIENNTMPDYVGTDYAECQGLHNYGAIGCCRWTRTATAVSEFPYSASDSGVLFTGDSANYTCFGICPAMNLKELKDDTNVSCLVFSSGENHTPGEYTDIGNDNHKYICANCGEEITEPHNWSYPKWDWTIREKPKYSSFCTVCGKEISGDAESVEIVAHEATVDTYAYTNYTAWVTLSGKACNGTFCYVNTGSVLAARMTAFEEYKAEKLSEADGLALETDGSLCAQAINDAKAAITALAYDEEKTLDENKEAIGLILENLSKDLSELRKVYYVVFVADGNIVAKIPYTAETQNIEAPAVPEKEGFSGKWSDYKLTASDITVNAFYEKISNPTAGAKLKVKSDEVYKNSKVTVIAKASNVPDGYVLAIYDGGNEPAAVGDNSSVKYEIPKEISATKTLTVKIIDKNGNVQKDASGKDLSENIEIKIKSGFLNAIIAFFKKLFGSNKVTIEP